MRSVEAINIKMPKSFANLSYKVSFSVGYIIIRTIIINRTSLIKFSLWRLYSKYITLYILTLKYSIKKNLNEVYVQLNHLLFFLSTLRLVCCLFYTKKLMQSYFVGKKLIQFFNVSIYLRIFFYFLIYFNIKLIFFIEIKFYNLQGK